MTGPANRPEGTRAVHPFLVKTEHVEALDGIRTVLARLRDLSKETGAGGAEVEDLDALIAHLDETFLLVVVGEVKSGKSFLVNTLLRRDICAVGATPVTDRINILRYGEEETVVEREPWLVERAFPSDRLRGLSIVDTPGTNSIVRRHEEITRRFLPRADVVLFVTSCDRPYTESENAFLHLISEEWRRKIVFVLSKTDIKEPDEITEILEFVTKCCEEELGFSPDVLPVALKPAREAARAGEEATGTGLAELEDFVLERLDDREKTRLRLFGVADAAEAILRRLRRAVGGATDRLARDYAALGELESHTDRKREELIREHHGHLTKLTEVFGFLKDRGSRFLEESFPATRLFRTRRGLEERFGREVVSDLKLKLALVSDEAVEWLSSETLRFSHFAEELFRARVLGPNGREEGDDGQGPVRFRAAREAALAAIRENAAEHIRGLDAGGAGREALAGTGRGVRISVAGIGTGVVAGAALAALLGPAGALLAIPFFAGGIVLSRSMRSKAQLRWVRRVDALAAEYRERFSDELRKAVDGALAGIREIYAPYLAFYEAEVAKMGDLDRRLVGLGEDLAVRRREIEEALE